MSDIDTKHNRWYMICPGKNYSMRITLLLTISFILFLPLVIVFYPIGFFIFYVAAEL